ncbi:MAG TPA: hypothetical protein QF873_01830 [Patescibacteria group bacterium]|nr:hypothetical protein [Patescibacteria group bacterium]
MQRDQYIRRIKQASRIPHGRLPTRKVDNGLIRITVAILRKIVHGRGKMINRFPELCAAAISWAQMCYACDCASNLKITLPTTESQLQHEGARDTLLSVALDLEELYN